MPTAQTVGIPSSTNIPVGSALTVHGNITANGGSSTNPNGTVNRFVGQLIGYHNVSMISGFPGGFATTADHQHLFWIVSSEATNERAQHQMMYTTGASFTSFVSAGRAGSVGGTALTNEHSIDTTGTTALPTAPGYVGRVKFRFTTSPSVTVGQTVLVTISTSQVAGIQAAEYTGTVAAGPTLVSGNYEVDIDMDGMDPLHWSTALAANTTEYNSRWAVAPLVTALGNKGSLAAVGGSNANCIDVTFAGSVPSSVVVGAPFSLLLKTGSTITGLRLSQLYTCTVQSISGLVARIRVKNQRFNSWETIGGSDSTTSRWDMFRGVRDMNHDIPCGLAHTTCYRDLDGFPTIWIFGNGDVSPAANNVVLVGSNISSSTSQEWKAGTSEANSMSLLSDVLTLGKLKVNKTNGTTISGIRIASATLVGGTVTVADANITASTVILPVRNVAAGTPGWLTTSRIASTSYTVTSSSGTDTSTIHVLLFEP